MCGKGNVNHQDSYIVLLSRHLQYIRHTQLKCGEEENVNGEDIYIVLQAPGMYKVQNADACGERGAANCEDIYIVLQAPGMCKVH